MKNIIIIIALLIGVSVNAQQLHQEYSEVVKNLKTHSGKHRLYDTLTTSIIWEEAITELSACLEINAGFGEYKLYFFTNGLQEGSVIYRILQVIDNDNTKYIEGSLYYFNTYYTIVDKNHWTYKEKDGNIRYIEHEVNAKHNLFTTE